MADQIDVLLLEEDGVIGIPLPPLNINLGNVEIQRFLPEDHDVLMELINYCVTTYVSSNVIPGVAQFSFKDLMTRVFLGLDEAYWDWHHDARTTLAKPFQFHRMSFMYYAFRFSQSLRRVFRQAEHKQQFKAHYVAYTHFEKSIPRAGVLFLNASLDKVLVVQPNNVYNNQPLPWSFPKGQVNLLVGESFRDAARREIREEINWDMVISPNTYFIEKLIERTIVRLFVLPYMSLETGFTPDGREIMALRWVDIDNILPEAGTPLVGSTVHTGRDGERYRGVLPFLEQLKIDHERIAHLHTIYVSSDSDMSDDEYQKLANRYLKRRD